MKSGNTHHNSGYAVSLPSVATPKSPYATFRATSHSRERYQLIPYRPLTIDVADARMKLSTTCSRSERS